jgi:hypothetical protein
MGQIWLELMHEFISNAHKYNLKVIQIVVLK